MMTDRDGIELEHQVRVLRRELSEARARIQLLETKVSELQDVAFPRDVTGCAMLNEGGDA
jgi:hypothetical protein